MNTFFYMIASITMVASQSCGGTDSFTISSTTYPGSEGCYSYTGIDENQERAFSSDDSLIIVSESITDPTEDQYYLFFYRGDGVAVLCASSDFALKIDHPVDISGKGWEFCYQDGENTIVSENEIVVTCGCEEESVEPVEEESEDKIDNDIEDEIEKEENMIEDEREFSSASHLFKNYTSMGMSGVAIGYFLAMMF